MSKNINISQDLENYIINNSEKLHQVQRDIIEYNKKLGDINRLQVSVLQAQFLNTLVRTSKIKKILEIGSFTGFSTLSMALALPADGFIISLDKNKEYSQIAKKFFDKAGEKITQIIKPALESLKEIETSEKNLILSSSMQTKKII